jgi:hypothetical protein
MNTVSAPTSFTTGKGHPDFDLRPSDLREILSEGLFTISRGSSVLAIVADKTRDDNTDVLFPLAAQILAEQQTGPRLHWFRSEQPQQSAARASGDAGRRHRKVPRSVVAVG